VTRRVLALDISATKAGVAAPTGRLFTLKAPAISVPKRGRGEIGRRLEWWEQTLTAVMDTYRPEIVAIEDYAFGANGRITTIAEVVGIPKRLAFAYGATLIDDITPPELKKWATTHGRADKGDMLSAAATLGADPQNDDEADAALLRLMVLAVADSPAALTRWIFAR
jgi:Holliday junction resolvasome RuvABC endonuclease subunit